MRRNLHMVSATAARLLFFGGRYLSLLFVARLLGTGAAGFLLAIAVVEVVRILFDYGLENSVLARFHQQIGADGTSFALGKGPVRLAATILGQLITTGLVGILCCRSNTPLALPLVASLQFTCLMGFGYLQAHLQTGRSGGMGALMRPLALAVSLQAALLWLTYHGYAPLFLSTICFEMMALAVCTFVFRRFLNSTSDPKAVFALASRFDLMLCRSVLARIAPLGNVALIGIAYNRLDAFAVSWVTSGVLLTQYLIYQRLASAPLMFFSTIASVSISTVSDNRHNPDVLPGKIVRFRRLAYGAAVLCGITLASSSPLIATFFSLEVINVHLIALQSLVLALQIANGFHAALLIALGKLPQLWRMARNNAFVALLLLPLGAWKWGTLGIALALCMIEAFCAAQHAWEFKKMIHRLEGANA